MSDVVLFPSSKHNYETQITLDGQQYSLVMTWNARHNSWYWQLYDAEGTDLTGQRRYSPDWPMLDAVLTDDMPQGRLYALTFHGDELGILELGTQGFLFYYTAEEIGRRG